MKIKLIIFFFFIAINSYSSESQLDEIMNTKKIKVCIWPEYYSISYLDRRTQKLTGIDTDLAQELGKYLGVNVKFVRSSFNTLIEDVNSNKCHIAMFAIGKTKKRMEKLRFTSTHLHSDIYGITTKSNSKINSWDDIDKKGIIVVVAKNTYHESVMKKKLTNANLLIVDSFKQREEEVLSGRADIFMTDYPYAKKMLEKKDWVKLISPSKKFYLTEYSWVVKYGDDKFYNKIEEFIKTVKEDGTLLKIAKKNALESIVHLK